MLPTGNRRMEWINGMETWHRLRKAAYPTVQTKSQKQTQTSVHVGLQLVWGLVGSTVAHAQVIPDNTLPTNSNVGLNGTTYGITGGTAVGSNLFHSFQQFSLPTGFQADFQAIPPNIQTIVSRVTGGLASTIDGTLRSTSTATLFLINPSGIVFGPNAQLALGGSFFASTAERVVFGDGTVFSARNPQATPLLTVSLPVGLQYGSTPGPLVNQSQAANNAGLQVRSGATLGLLGGSLTLTNGHVTAPQGQIELGSVGEDALLGLIPTGTSFAVSYAGVQNFQPLRLEANASANASGPGAGSILARGSTITLTQNSHFVADTLGPGVGGLIRVEGDTLTVVDGAFIGSTTVSTGSGAAIAIIAPDSVTLSTPNNQVRGAGDLLNVSARLNTRQNGIITAALNGGAAGPITITTGHLSLLNRSQIASDTFGSGAGGDITVRATRGIDLTGYASLSTLTALGSGQGGNVDLQTSRVRVQAGAGITTSNAGSGQGGNLTINASESVAILDSPRNATFPTNIASLTSFLAGTTGLVNTGAGGNVTLTTGQLTIESGALLSSSSGGLLPANGIAPVGGKAGNLTVRATDIDVSGDVIEKRFFSNISSVTVTTAPAGILHIDTQRLTVRDGARISVATSGLGAGQGGNLVINATDWVRVTGLASDRQSASTIAATSGDPVFELRATGRAGDVQITTGTLRVDRGATVAVNSLGTADGGTLQVNANRLSLADQGTLTAATRSGQGGEIQLVIRDLLLLRRNSLISAEAGGNGQGGNIDITAGFVVAPALDNSDIQANAFAGTGGNIRITTRGIYGLQFRPRSTPLSDITASSTFGISGAVTLTTPNLDPSRSAVALPTGLVDIDSLIATSCVANRTYQGRLTITGTRGLLNQTHEPISPPFSLLPDPLLAPAAVTGPNSPNSIVEMDGFYQLPNGEMILGRGC
jgi:filamentous hemagglutinin family protein